MQTRSEQGGKDDYVTVWAFRVEAFDSAGNRVSLTPVEMRGYRFDGTVHDGDWVRARGRRKGGTLHVDRLQNLTTGADVRAQRMSKIVLIPAVIFMIAVLAFVIWGFFMAFTQGGDPGEFPEVP
ncbi:hypothetical protein [Streptomyces nigrescens]|uniref:hypothetical protein n=1 Tax=Streptomyces nigrescens TaxID=1920 RepID=UPI00348E91CB